MRLMESWRFWRSVDARTRDFDWKCKMSLKVKFGILAAGLMLSGCMQATTYEATNTTNFKARDKELLAKVSYTKVAVAEPFRRAIGDYHRKEAAGSIVVDSDRGCICKARRAAKRIRTGRTGGEEAG